MEPIKKAPQVFEGRTAEAEAPFLGGDFWKVGFSVRGTVSRIYETDFDGKKGTCYVLDLDSPVEVDGEDWERASIGNLAGFRMALQSMKLERLRLNDEVEMECEDIKPAKKEGYSPRPNFRLKVTRP